MTTTRYEGPSRVELELLLRAAARAASPQEHGRQQASRATASVVRGLMVLAGVVATYDLSLLVGGA